MLCYKTEVSREINMKSQESTYWVRITAPKAWNRTSPNERGSLGGKRHRAPCFSRGIKKIRSHSWWGNTVCPGHWGFYISSVLSIPGCNRSACQASSPCSYVWSGELGEARVGLFPPRLDGQLSGHRLPAAFPRDGVLWAAGCSAVRQPGGWGWAGHRCSLLKWRKPQVSSCDWRGRQSWPAYI